MNLHSRISRMTDSHTLLPNAIYVTGVLDNRFTIFDDFRVGGSLGDDIEQYLDNLNKLLSGQEQKITLLKSAKTEWKK